MNNALSPRRTNEVVDRSWVPTFYVQVDDGMHTTLLGNKYEIHKINSGVLMTSAETKSKGFVAGESYCFHVERTQAKV